MKAKAQKKNMQRVRRHARIRAKISGTAECPRLAVFRSNQFMYVQIINDIDGTTIAEANDKGVDKGTKTERAKQVGQEIARKGKEKGIFKVVFDRGGYLYAGRVKSLAEGAREGGLEF